MNKTKDMFYSYTHATKRAACSINWNLFKGI